MNKCQKCGKIFKKDYRRDKKWIKSNPQRFCSRFCANSNLHSVDTKIKIGDSLRGEWINITCKQCSKPMKIRKSSLGVKKFCSRKCLALFQHFSVDFSRKMSKALKGKTGGRKDFNGKNCGYYKGILFQSSWELAFIVYNLEYQLPIKRNFTYFPYTYQNELFKYYPDFICGSEYIEVKGWYSNRSKEKKEQFPKDKQLKVLLSEDMLPYITYCKTKYGRNYIDILRDKKPLIV